MKYFSNIQVSFHFLIHLLFLPCSVIKFDKVSSTKQEWENLPMDKAESANRGICNYSFNSRGEKHFATVEYMGYLHTCSLRKTFTPFYK
jgi:hypothetical protein